jgi:hypothetical protein
MTGMRLGKAIGGFESWLISVAGDVLHRWGDSVGDTGDS